MKQKFYGFIFLALSCSTLLVAHEAAPVVQAAEVVEAPAPVVTPAPIACSDCNK